jgi:hypothetical protein
MEAETLLQRLCERHGVDPNRCERLLSLVRWALKGPLETRSKVLAVVERNIAATRDGVPGNAAELAQAADRAVLMAVAKVLHTWSPGDGSVQF